MGNGKFLRISKSIQLLLLGFTLMGFSSGDTHRTSPTKQRYKNYQASVFLVQSLDLKEGDLAFRTGHDILSQMVLTQGNAPQFSHVGIIVSRENRWMVIHAVPKSSVRPAGVIIEPLEDFIATGNAKRFGLYRHQRLTQNARPQLKRYALQQVGKAFDTAFLLSDDTKLYCSELALKALQIAGIENALDIPGEKLMLLNEPVILPDSIARSEEFTVIR